MRQSSPAKFLFTAAVFLVMTGSDAISQTSHSPDAGKSAEAKKLIDASGCESCHAGKVGGNGSAMYTRKDRKVLTRAKLVAQVARCSSELNLGLFPDDEAAIAAYLNITYYKFKD